MVSWYARMFLLLIIASAAAVVVSAIDWGLPSKSSNEFLFATESWTGKELAEFDEERKASNLGADVDRDPVDLSGGPVVISRTNAERAEIIRRFRLYSHQPDEMITFMALQQMDPAKFELDPRMYQYGGVWIYPVGALLKVSSALGWIDLRADKAFYYDNPEAFGRFYIVARAYTAAWLVVLLGCVATIARKITHSDAAAVTATALVALMPVVFAMAHEAKPHLGGVALMLLACIFAGRWIERGRRRDAIMAGAACGLAAGIVLSGAVGLIVLPAMIMLRRVPWTQRLVTLLLTSLIAVAAYAVSNPYVAINLFTDTTALTSNLSNSRAMYGGGDATAMLRDGMFRFLEAASIPVMAIAVFGLIAMIVRRRPMSPTASLLMVLSALVTLQFVLLAANKPAEYARFALLPVVGLGIAVVWAMSLIPWRMPRVACFVLTPLTVAALATWPYYQAFLADTQPNHTRAAAAQWLDDPTHKSHEKIQVFATPAPYNLPPIDPWRWQIMLSRQSDPSLGHIVLRPIDYIPTGSPPAGYRRKIIAGQHRAAPITWANKPFELLIRE